MNHQERGDPGSETERERGNNVTLTRREREALHHAAHGLCMSETALAMKITHETVKTHLKRAQAKLGARNGKHAVWLYAKETL